MAAAENKAAILAIVNRLFNEGDLSVVDEVFATDYVDRAQLPEGFPPDREAVRLFVPMLRSAFPDLHLEIKANVVEDDMAATMITSSGTHRGELVTPMGAIPPTGKSATWTEMHFSRLRDGKLVEHWVQQDIMGMMAQLGLLPAPGQ